MDTNGVWEGAGNNSYATGHNGSGKKNQSSLTTLVFIGFLIIFLLLKSSPAFAGFTMPSGTPPSGVNCYILNGYSGNSSAEVCFAQQTYFDALYDSYASNALFTITSCPAGTGTVEILETSRDLAAPGPNLIKVPMSCSGTAVCQPGTGYNTLTGMCDKACPANSTRSDLYPFQCTCNTGYKFDVIGRICVPLRECTIPDLPPITDPEVQLFEDSPNRADTARLSSRMQTALTCLKTAAAAGSPSTGSAYRPRAYNQHLIDVWNKWREFETNKNYDQQDCAARREKIRLHFKAHGLKEKQPPVPNSAHTRGEAVDVTINLPPANIDALAPTCRLYRPPSLRITDPVHFIYR